MILLLITINTYINSYYLIKIEGFTWDIIAYDSIYNITIKNYYSHLSDIISILLITYFTIILLFTYKSIINNKKSPTTLIFINLIPILFMLFSSFFKNYYKVFNSFDLSINIVSISIVVFLLGASTLVTNTILQRMAPIVSIITLYAFIVFLFFANQTALLIGLPIISVAYLICYYILSKDTNNDFYKLAFDVTKIALVAILIYKLNTLYKDYDYIKTNNYEKIDYSYQEMSDEFVSLSPFPSLKEINNKCVYITGYDEVYTYYYPFSYIEKLLVFKTNSATYDSISHSIIQKPIDTSMIETIPSKGLNIKNIYIKDIAKTIKYCNSIEK